MMAGNTSIPSLSDEVRCVIWRIFGAGVSPLKCRSTIELIEPVIRKRVRRNEQSRAIAEIHAWFERIGNEWRLRPDMVEPVAVTIIDGIGFDRSETAVFAVGSIDGDFAASTIGSNWAANETDSFIVATLDTLESLCNVDQVLDATRDPDLVSLETFRNLSIYGHRLIYAGLHTAVENLIRLVFELRRELLRSAIKRLDHPVIQARVADYMIRSSNPPSSSWWPCRLHRLPRMALSPLPKAGRIRLHSACLYPCGPAPTRALVASSAALAVKS